MSTSKVVQELLIGAFKRSGFDEAAVDEVVVEYVGDLFASWFTDGYGLEELEASLIPILGSCGLNSTACVGLIDDLDRAFSIKSRTGLGPQITAVVPIETPVQMALSPITVQMNDEPKKVSLDWLSTKRVVASQVDRSKLEKAEAKLRAKALQRKGAASTSMDRFEEYPGMPVVRKQTPEEIVNALIQEECELDTGSSLRNKRDVHVEGFDISIGGRRILTNATLMIAHGRRYGLIGRNGIGKSTLLRHIAGRMLDGLPEGLTILHVEQEVIGNETSALKSVLQADIKREALLYEEAKLQALLQDPAQDHDSDHVKRAHDRLQMVYRLLQNMDSSDAEARACQILAGLGFASSDFDRATREFSGGWRMRLALARALFCRPDLLLLDEPTNMLDFPAVVWLEAHLREWAGTLLVVSHDRYFLDGVVTDIIHMHDEELEVYRGDYNQFLATRADRQKAQQREYEAQQLYRANLQAFIDRWRYNANRAPQAQSRLKILEKLPELKPVIQEAPVVFKFPAIESLPSPLIQVDNASFAYDLAKQPALLQNIDLNIQLDTRMAIVGPNGAGKTTLLKLVVGKLDPIAGRVTISSKLRIGYFSQHHIDQLDLSMNALQLLQSRFPGKADEEYRAQLGSFGLSGPLGLQTIKTLSGGQKSRVVFAALCMQSPHLMILDEPTNHLDMDSIDALINAMRVYQGGVVVVSHDKKFIDALCKEIWLCKEGRLSRFDGTIHEYARSLVAGVGKLSN